MEEFFSKEVEAEDGECPEENGSKFQSRDRIAEYRDEKSLDIDKEAFSAEVRGVEDIEISGFDGMKRIDAVCRLIGVEADRDIFDLIKTDDESEEDNGEKGSGHSEGKAFAIDHMCTSVSPHVLGSVSRF